MNGPDGDPGADVGEGAIHDMTPSGGGDHAHDLSPDDIAHEAYLYYYPLVVMEHTRQQLCANAMTMGIDLVANPFIHSGNIANAKWRSVARTNIDTLFSSCWLDTGNGAATMTVPESNDAVALESGARFFMYQALDMWSDTFAVLGSRTLGDAGATVQFVPPDRTSDQHRLEPGATASIRTPTRFSWIIGRTYTSNTVDDLAAARRHQAGVGIVYERPPATLLDVDESMSGESPVAIVDSFNAEQFFELADRLHRREGSHATDWSILLRLRRVGLAMSSAFRFAQQPAIVQRALSRAVVAGNGLTRNRDAVSIGSGHWQQFQSGIGTYGNDYLRRAIIARFGLAANPREDAVYISTSRDSRGIALDGRETYHLRFAPDGLPPATYFWSITAYDGDGHFMANEWDKLGVSGRDPLVREGDGSLVVSIGPVPPSQHVANWIPTAAPRVTLTLRLYGPSDDVLSGRWWPPSVVHEFGER